MSFPAPRGSSIRWRIASLLIVLAASTAIVSTYGVFSQTYDEPGHVAAGMEWWQLGRYTFEEQHPPLARAAVAAAPYASGLRLRGSRSMWEEGNAILYGRARYTQTLAQARAGILPFFLLACLVVHAWARSLGGGGAGFAATVLFVSSWPVLAHAGLATTDMAVTATLAAALLAYQRWLDRPSGGRSFLFGLTGAAAILSKFSALLLFPAAALVLTLAWWRAGGARARDAVPARRASYPRGLGIAAWTAALLIWAAYRFSLRWIDGVPLPAPELVIGVYQVLHHGAIGHASYLLGERSTTGWWYYFPFVLALKTPIPLLLLAVAGGLLPSAFAARADAWRAAALPLAALAMLLVMMTSSINVGVRYLLPVFPLLAIAGGVGLVALWRRQRAGWMMRGLAAGLVVWQLVGVVRAHPDHLAAFNELAGPTPERLVDDSNVDWGQDLLRLAEVVRARGLTGVHLAYYGTADPMQHLGASYRRLAPGSRAVGWVAVSERYLAGIVDGRIDDGYLWLRKYVPGERIGRSIHLLRVTAEER